MKNPQIQKPSLSDYNRISEFAHVCSHLNSTLSLLNNHIDVLKRSGDVDSIRDLDNELYSFLSKIVTNYKSTLKDVKED